MDMFLITKILDLAYVQNYMRCLLRTSPFGLFWCNGGSKYVCAKSKKRIYPFNSLLIMLESN